MFVAVSTPSCCVMSQHSLTKDIILRDGNILKTRSRELSAKKTADKIMKAQENERGKTKTSHNRWLITYNYEWFSRNRSSCAPAAIFISSHRAKNQHTPVASRFRSFSPFTLLFPPFSYRTTFFLRFPFLLLRVVHRCERENDWLFRNWSIHDDY